MKPGEQPLGAPAQGCFTAAPLSEMGSPRAAGRLLRAAKESVAHGAAVLHLLPAGCTG